MRTDSVVCGMRYSNNCSCWKNFLTLHSFDKGWWDFPQEHNTWNLIERNSFIEVTISVFLISYNISLNIWVSPCRFSGVLIRTIIICIDITNRSASYIEEICSNSFGCCFLKCSEFSGLLLLRMLIKNWAVVNMFACSLKLKWDVKQVVLFISNLTLVALSRRLQQTSNIDHSKTGDLTQMCKCHWLAIFRNCWNHWNCFSWRKAT